MRRPLVYDLPTRVFHWLFAVFFIVAFAISNLVDDDSARFALHMLAGLGMVFVVILRLVWSLVGTRHARLADLVLSPVQLVAYFRGMFGKRMPSSSTLSSSMLSGSARSNGVPATGRRHWSGHNPASSWAAVAMVGLALGLGASGWLMATGGENDAIKEVHELMANAFLVVVLLHLAGVAVHVLRHRDHLQASMVTGRKQLPGSDQAPVRAMPIAGFAFVAFTGLFMGYLQQHYDAQARTLDLFGTTMQLGENETGTHSGNSDGDGHERD